MGILSGGIRLANEWDVNLSTSYTILKWQPNRLSSDMTESAKTGLIAHDCRLDFSSQTALSIFTVKITKVWVFFTFSKLIGEDKAKGDHLLNDSQTRGTKSHNCHL